MPLHTTLRLASMLLTALLARWLHNDIAWPSLVFSLGFSHFFMGLYYSKKQLKQIFGQSSSYLPLAIVLLFGGLLYWRNFPLVVYFAVHHVFNEVYLLKYSNRVEAHPEISRLRTSSLFLNLFIYLVILQDHRELRFLDPVALYGGLALSIAGFIYCLMAVRPLMTRHELIDASAFEVIGVLLVGFSFFVHITFLQIVCYHVVFWIFFPMTKMAKNEPMKLVRYSGAMAGLTAFFVYLSPAGSGQYSFSYLHFSTLFIQQTYLHITISYALSSSHPSWIARWFKPQQAVLSSSLP